MPIAPYFSPIILNKPTMKKLRILTSYQDIEFTVEGDSPILDLPTIERSFLFLLRANEYMGRDFWFNVYREETDYLTIEFPIGFEEYALIDLYRDEVEWEESIKLTIPKELLELQFHLN